MTADEVIQRVMADRPTKTKCLGSCDVNLYADGTLEFVTPDEAVSFGPNDYDKLKAWIIGLA